MLARPGAGILRRKPYPVFQAIERGELVAFHPSGKGPWLIRTADLRAHVEGVAA